MSLAEAVAAAQGAFPWVTVGTSAGSLPLPVVMVAIAGAESGWDPTARGDYGRDPGYGLCDGYSSWGLWQIHNVHAAYLTQVSGTSSPCGWAAWLFNPAHNAQAAASVWRSQGLTAWTSYTNGAWRQYLPAAEAAFGQTAGGAAPSPAPAPSATVPGVVPAGPGPSLGALVLLGLIALVWADVGESVVRDLSP